MHTDNLMNGDYGNNMKKKFHKSENIRFPSQQNSEVDYVIKSFNSKQITSIAINIINRIKAY